MPILYSDFELNYCWIGASARVAPLLIDLSPPNLSGPLSQFQTVALDKSSFYKLIQSINSGRNKPQQESSLRRLFDALWPVLEEKILKSSKSWNKSLSPLILILGQIEIY